MRELPKPLLPENLSLSCALIDFCGGGGGDSCRVGIVGEAESNVSFRLMENIPSLCSQCSLPAHSCLVHLLMVIFFEITDYADSKPFKLAPHGWGPALNVLPTRYVTTPWYWPLGLLTTL